MPKNLDSKLGKCSDECKPPCHTHYPPTEKKEECNHYYCKVTIHEPKYCKYTPELPESLEEYKEILYGFWEEYVNEEDGDRRDKIIEKYTGEIAAKIKEALSDLLSELDKMNK